MEQYHNELESGAARPMTPAATIPHPQTPARGYVNNLARRFGLDDFETPPRVRQVDIDQECALYLNFHIDPSITILKFWEVRFWSPCL